MAANSQVLPSGIHGSLPWQGGSPLAQFCQMHGKPKAPDASPGALVRSSRRELAWVPNEKLSDVAYKEPSTALGLGLISGGGGYLYSGDTQKGLMGVAAMVGVLASGAVLPGGLVFLGVVAVAGWGAIGSWLQCRTINRFLWRKQQANASASGLAPAHQLLASMPASLPAPAITPESAHSANPASLAQPTANGAHDDLITRLQKLAAIRAAGVIDDNEHRARKIDLLSGAASGLGPEETETLLFTLLPILDAGTLNEEDLQFVKDLGT